MKLAIFLLFLTKLSFAMKNYTGYTLFRGVPHAQEHVQFLTNLSEVMEVNYWSYPGLIQMPVDILVPPQEKRRFMEMLDNMTIDYTTVLEDVQRVFDDQTVKPYTRRKMETFDFKHFYKLDDIYNWMTDLSLEKPSEVKIMKIGKTYENRDILALRINLIGARPRSTVVIEGGVHAREWISPSFVCYLIQEIVFSKGSNDEELRNISLLYDWYFVPVLNPDGYVYSFEHDRMWRKNRRGGYGVDVNRNFDSAFGSVGISTRTKHETFCGSHAFSENESVAMKKLIERVGSRLEYYFAFHSYGQYAILPYAHDQKHRDNYEEMKAILDRAKKAIARRYGTLYHIGTAYDTVGYMTSGVSCCWVKKTHRVPYVATFELRDDGKYGFGLPANQIIPTCRETLDGLKSIFKPKHPSFLKLEQPDKQSRNLADLLTIMFIVIFSVI